MAHKGDEAKQRREHEPSKFLERKNTLNDSEGFKEVREKLQSEIYKLHEENKASAELIQRYDQEKAELNQKIEGQQREEMRHWEELEEKNKVITNLHQMLENERK